MMQLRQEVIDLEQQNRRLQDEIEQRRQRVGRLQTDPAERERAVREATKKQKPGETTIFVQE
jgi:cell division protein FtsB